ncbi:MAG: Zn-dependent protease protein [Verrucomicrobiales bacterium]|nr:Zn-dependent protease protein [Verrucomicrobiales bacterium]
MAETPQTFSESWYRIANQQIALRQGINVRRQNFRGERWIILENPFSNQFFRLTPAAYEFVARLRRDRTVAEIWKECMERFPDIAPGQEQVIQLLSQLYYANLLQYSDAADSAQLFERYQRMKQRETQSRWLNIMFMRFPLLDPDIFLNKTIGFVGKLINPIGALIWAMVVGWALKLAFDNWSMLKAQSEGVLAPQNLPLLYLGLVFVKSLHEFGHAYFCKKYGGEVHVMGVLIMIFTPTPYVDATSSWSFRSRKQRILVGAAGMIVELFVAAIAMMVWANSSRGVVHNLCYNIVFVASVSTVLFNLNPLLRFDGYYILSDLLDIPNLSQRSTRHLRHLFERYIFGIRKSESPSNSNSEKAWFTVFGISSGIYRVFVFGRILLFVADRLLLIGIIMAVVCAISWICVPVVKYVKYLASDPILDRHRVRAVAITAGLAAVLIVLLDVIPFPRHFRASGVVEAKVYSHEVNGAAGFMSRLVALPGSQVKAGDTLAVFSNPELELELAASKANRTETQARLLQAMGHETANIKPLSSKLDSVEKRISRINVELASLTLRARQNGFWVAPSIEEGLGRWFAKGTSMGLIVDPGSFEFVATVLQDDVDQLFANTNSLAQVRIIGQADTALSASNFRKIPAETRKLPSPALGWTGGGDIPVAKQDSQGQHAAEPFFQVRADIQSTGDVALLHGRTGKVRFDLEPEPLFTRGIRKMRQLLQKRYQI